MSDLLHRVRNAAHDAFGITDDEVREAVDACIDDARDLIRDGVDPDLNDAWSSLFEAESLIDSYRSGAAPSTTFGGVA